MINCPTCDARIRAPDNAVGRQVKCPKCGSTFTASAPGAAPEQEESPLSSAVVAPSEPEPENWPPPRTRSKRTRDSSGNDIVDFLLFRKLVAPIIIQILFWLGLLGVLGFGCFQLLMAAMALTKSVEAGLFLFCVAAIYLVLGPIVVRLYCEMLIVIFRIYETLSEMNDRMGDRP